jgi:hypothetical protein
LSFRDAFINAAEFGNFNAQQAKRALKGCMRGQAYLAIQELDHVNDNETVEGLLDSYEERFVPPAASDMAKAKYETAVQGPKEEVLQWHARLRGLAVRGYGQDVLPESQLIRVFARGLRQKRVREHVLRSQTDTYIAALHAALIEQSVLDSGNYIPGAAPESVTNVGGHYAGGARRHGGAEPMEIGALGSGKIQCHNCHLFGHVQRDCTFVKKTVAPGTAVATAAGGARFKPRPAKTVGGPMKGKTDNKPRYKRFVNALAEVVREYGEGEPQEGDSDEEEEQEEEAEASPDEPQEGF